MRAVTAFVTAFVTAVVTVLLALLPAAPAATAKPVYVALGDSYASGVGTGAYRDDGTTCRRSSAAYPALAARALGYRLRFRACAGATVAHVTAAQLGALRRSTRYVTLSVGGNDAGFAGVLTTCATPWWLGDCERAVAGARRFVRDSLTRRLQTLYAEVRRRAPLARVVVVGYPRIFMGEDCDAGTWFSADEQRRLNGTADLLNARLGAAARGAGFAFADPTSAFRGHAVCDEAEWVNGLSFPVAESYHPHRAGHASGLLPLVRPLLRGAPARAAVVRPAAEPSPARARGVRTAPFRRPDLTTPRAERAARRHGIDLDRWLARHP
ncbi:SGNH/GDSL hydrolase family protein [Nocardioides dongkuii]|uniref:SGNH/GDSL hydrolase family protein n=1 Tax=Nocardioides dongkuii TaxID=2760089 RepID=UPI0015FE6F68|nr:SGNH/GDSL hydrolase family protein [Nocardioides dongkuii]